MSYEERYHEWTCQLAAIMHNKNEEERRRNRLIAAICINECINLKKKYKKKRFWIDPLFEKRREHGFYYASVPRLTPEKFRNYYRMTATQFEELLYLVAPAVTKQTVIREPLPPAERLSITLRYLATGDSMHSMSFHYLAGVSTISHVIGETCDAIWNSIRQEIMPPSKTTEEWLYLAKEFQEKWDFNHCIGAIDGKHVVIECPPNAGSSYYNYKNSHSIVLLGICDAQYMFTFVDIGAYGRHSDGGIFKDSKMGLKFNSKEMNVPAPEPFSPGGPSLPYVLMGDEAFQLTDYLMRPYPGKGGLNDERNIYNYRLSRARRTIENTFGILVSQWRILKRPINCSMEKTISIVKAIVCLHNWIRRRDIDDGENQYVTPTLIDQEDDDGFVPGSWRGCIDNSVFVDITQCGSNNSSRRAM
ncbi:uncharacterized protein LOC105259170 [Camponotus floridanus]|uniref:uncharacterized protein LOC105259170 n=1 Tax=Camponotus floridanus TaxID=104421 RepID=UPI000DC6B4C6|nr:uncharacterized protein LOC105259170 [Camponotus floridanus]